MPRIRSIKPSFFTHEDLSLLPAETHLLAAGLLCYADDEGYFQAHPKLVQAAIFPLREASVSVPEMLRSLQEIGYIDSGNTPDGKRYGRIVNFATHQKVSHATPSTIKNLHVLWEGSGVSPESSVNPPDQPIESSVNPPEPLRPELKGIELKGIEGEGEEKRPPAPIKTLPRKPPPSGVGANGEFLLATGLLHELGIAAHNSDVAVLAQVLTFEARNRGDTDGEPTANWLLAEARKAMARGDLVNVFWFKDRKFAVEERDIYAAYLAKGD